MSDGFKLFRKFSTGLAPLMSPPGNCRTIPFIAIIGSALAVTAVVLFSPRTIRYPLLIANPGVLITALRTLPFPPFSKADEGIRKEVGLTLLLSYNKSL